MAYGGGCKDLSERDLTRDGHLSWRTLLPDEEPIKWMRFVDGRIIPLDNEDDLGPRSSLEVQVEEESRLDRSHKKRQNDDDDNSDVQQGSGEKRTRRLTEQQEVEYRRSLMNKQGKKDHPRNFTEEIRRINRLKARVVKRLREEIAQLIDQNDSKGYAEVTLPPALPPLAGVGRARVSMERINLLRVFSKTKFPSVSKESLYFANEDEANDFEEKLAFLAHAYEEALETVADALEEHDEKGYLECNADGTIRISKRPESLDDQPSETS